MTRRVIISGLGTVSALGIGIQENWQGAVEGRIAIGPIQAFDASGFDCQLAGEVRDFRVMDFVPKSYRKATKVMARDIELAVAAADLAARDAGLITKGTGGNGATPSYPPARLGANIGASLIACELDELTVALAEARREDGSFDIHKWGSHGMTQLTPLWLLKYLPNMLACHVTIIHDAQGPSNTITCAEASSALSLGEALRVIQRGAADAVFCGGAESRINPMAMLRQQMLGRLNTQSNDRPEQAVRPYWEDAAGTVLGEAGGILILEALETFERRRGSAETAGGTGPRAYAEVVGFGASQTVYPPTRNLTPDPEGRAIGIAIRAALAEAGIKGEEVDVVFGFGDGEVAFDRAERAALERELGRELGDVPVVSLKPMLGNCGAAAGALDLCMAAKALAEQVIPARVNMPWSTAAQAGELKYALVCTSSLGGQNAAVVLRRMD